MEEYTPVQAVIRLQDQIWAYFKFKHHISMYFGQEQCVVRVSVQGEAAWIQAEL